MSTIREGVLSICEQARSAAAELRTLSGQVRSDALAAMPAALEASREAVQEANDADLEDARQAGMPEHLIKRLAIDDKIFAYMQSRLKKLAAPTGPGWPHPGGTHPAKRSTGLEGFRAHRRHRHHL